VSFRHLLHALIDLAQTLSELPAHFLHQFVPEGGHGLLELQLHRLLKLLLHGLKVSPSPARQNNLDLC
jgi:hypothetical protein